MYSLSMYSKHELLYKFPSVDDSFLEGGDAWNVSLKENGCFCEQASNMTDVTRAAIAEVETRKISTILMIRFPDNYKLSTEHFMDADSEVLEYAAHCIPNTVKYEWLKTETSGAVVTDADGDPVLEMRETIHHEILWKVAVTNGKLLSKRETPKNKAMARLALQLSGMKTALSLHAFTENV
jgi:hypothetical protein